MKKNKNSVICIGLVIIAIIGMIFIAASKSIPQTILTLAVFLSIIFLFGLKMKQNEESDE